MVDRDHQRPQAVVAMIVDMLGRIGQREIIPPVEVLQAACQALVAMGFERVRYYNVAVEQIPKLPETRRIYLAWQGPDDVSPMHTQRIGYAIDWDKTSLAEEESPENRSIRPSVRYQPAEPAASGSREWILDLGLAGRAWIDIAVYDQANLIGLLAADWAGSASDLSQADLDILSLFGSVLGSELSATTPRINEALDWEVSSLNEDVSLSNTAFVIESVERLASSSIDASTVSLFQYRWQSAEVHRTAIFPPERGENFAETYRAGEFLTGNAWLNDSYRKIWDFPKFRNGLEAEMVNQDSIAYHQQIGGPIKSVIYGRVGEADPNYLIRVINTERPDAGPLIFEQSTLDSFVSRLSELYDTRLAGQRSEAVSEILEMLGRHARPGDVIQVARSAARDIEQVSGFVVIAIRSDDRRPYNYDGLLPTIKERIRDKFSQDPRIQRALVDGGVHHYFGTSSVLATIAKEQFGAVGLQLHVFASGQTRGLVVVPLYCDRTTFLQDVACRELSRSFLSQMASLIGQSLEDEIIGIQSKYALRALSLVGHEMVTPLAAMRSISDYILDAAAEGVRNIDAGVASAAPLIEEFNDLRRAIAQSTEILESGIRLGQLVGRQNDRRVVGVFRRADLRTLIDRAIFAVRTEVFRGLLYCPGRPEIAKVTGADRVTLMCDAPLTESILTNLYRNALKYAVSAKSGRVEVKTEVVVSRSGTAHVMIQNVGRHIADDSEEQIFEPFVRFDETASDVGRRGMGLGLFLARNIAKAHGGDAVLKSHVRLGKAEAANYDRPDVYRTTFALELRTDLPRGDYSYSLDDD